MNYKAMNYKAMNYKAMNYKAMNYKAMKHSVPKARSACFMQQHVRLTVLFFQNYKFLVINF